MRERSHATLKELRAAVRSSACGNAHEWTAHKHNGMLRMDYTCANAGRRVKMWGSTLSAAGSVARLHGYRGWSERRVELTAPAQRAVLAAAADGPLDDEAALGTHLS